MKFVKINDKKYPASPGYSPLKLFCAKRENQLEFHEMFDHLSKLNFDKITIQLLDDFGLLLWCFIERGCEIMHQENDLTVNDCIDFIGKEKYAPEIIELLYESFGVNINLQEEKKPAKKK